MCFLQIELFVCSQIRIRKLKQECQLARNRGEIKETPASLEAPPASPVHHMMKLKLIFATKRELLD